MYINNLAEYLDFAYTHSYKATSERGRNREANRKQQANEQAQ